MANNDCLSKTVAFNSSLIICKVIKPSKAKVIKSLFLCSLITNPVHYASSQEENKHTTPYERFYTCLKYRRALGRCFYSIMSKRVFLEKVII